MPKDTVRTRAKSARPTDPKRYHVLVQIEKDEQVVVYTYTTGERPAVGQYLPAKNRIPCGNTRNALVGKKHPMLVIAVFDKEAARFFDAVEAFNVLAGAGQWNSAVGDALSNVVETIFGAGTNYATMHPEQFRNESAA